MGGRSRHRPQLDTVRRRADSDAQHRIELLCRPTTTAPAVLQALSHGFERPAHAQPRLPAGSPDHIDELLAHLKEQWHALVRTDNLLGPRFALAAVLDHFAVIGELLPITNGCRRTELVTLAAAYAESAG